MKDKIVLISKDAFGTMNLPQYGNKFWTTPNIDRLVAVGTLFKKHYTTAPSTGMAFTSMFTGKYPYELEDRRIYAPVQKYAGDTLFDIFKSCGYSCHIIWDQCFNSYALPFANCFGEEKGTMIHSLNLREPVGGHKMNQQDIVKDDSKTKEAMESLFKEIKAIDFENKRVFLWIHLPHVISGRTGYGSDVDTVDQLVGWFLDNWGYDCVFLTGDHGHMNLTKNRIGYGWDLGESAVHVPLITPRIDDLEIVDYTTSHVDLAEIIFNHFVKKREYIVIDTAYYAQPRRKIGIISENYKYVYDKYLDREYLYDLHYDTNEDYNLLLKQKYDPDRNKIVNISEVVFYPYLDEIDRQYNKLRIIKTNLWKEETKKERIRSRIKLKLLNYKLRIVKKRLENRFVKNKKRYDG